MAIKKACVVGNSIKNTGKECDIAMKATAMIVPIEPSVKFDDADLDDAYSWLELLIHQKKAFPLFGQKAPIRYITNNTEADTLVTADDGSRIFVRYGMYNRELATTSGGLCYAAALQSLLESGYSLLEIDQTGRMLARKNEDKTYSGLITDFMYSPAPALADFKDVFKNRFQYTYSPVELVNNGVIFDGAQSLLSIMGLIEAEITQAAPATTTKLKIGVKTECAETDLVALIGSPLALVANFIVKNSATNVVVTPTAAAIVTGWIELTGTFVSGQKYKVYGSAPEVWYNSGAGVAGYDASGNFVEITIP